MSKKQNYNKIGHVLLTLFLLVLTIISGQVTLSAFAETTTYTSALEDLQKDSSFNVSDYPDKSNDYSIQVIQIAESTNGELFVYTYQPCQRTRYLVATQINMSLTDSANTTTLYDLTILNGSGVFVKYKVNNFAVSPASERYYNITSIYRDLISSVDTGTDNGNIKNKKAFAVGQCWQATTQGETVKYKMLEVEVVEIINPFTSYIRRKKNQSTNKYYQDNYYVAFSTNRNIEKLLSATVSYRIQDYFYKENNWLGFNEASFWEKSTFSNERKTEKDIYCDEVIELQQQGFDLFGIFDLNKNFSWQRIQSSADFVQNSGASSADKDEIKKLQWVLMFDEVSVYRYESSGSIINKHEEAGQIIDEVTILRLEFVEDGKTYNLGAVSDTVSKDPDFGGDNNGANDGEKQGFWAYIWNCIKKLFTLKANGWETFVAIVAIAVALIAVVLVIKLGKWIFRGIFK